VGLYAGDAGAGTTASIENIAKEMDRLTVRRGYMTKGHVRDKISVCMADLQAGE